MKKNEENSDLYKINTTFFFKKIADNKEKKVKEKFHVKITKKELYNITLITFWQCQKVINIIWKQKDVYIYIKKGA